MGSKCSWGNIQLAAGRGSSSSSLGCEVVQRNMLVVDFSNAPVFGQKAWRYLAEVDDAERPDLHFSVEAHLMGSYLNQARRRLKKLGWRSFTTAAIPKTSKLYGDLGEDGGADTLKKFCHNSWKTTQTGVSSPR